MTTTNNSSATETLNKYARLTAADMDGDMAAAVRAMRDELGEVSRETGLDKATILAWIEAQ